MANEIRIEIGTNKFLVVSQNTDPCFNFEVFAYIEENGCIIQDIAIVRPNYIWHAPVDWPIVNGNLMEVIVFGDKDMDDYTNKFTIPVRKDDEE